MQITEKVFDLIKASIADGLGTETKGMVTYEADTSVDAYVRTQHQLALRHCGTCHCCLWTARPASCQRTAAMGAFWRACMHGSQIKVLTVPRAFVTMQLL